MRSFAGEVSLVVAGSRIENDPGERSDCGWTGYVSQLDAHVLPADHFGLIEVPTVDRTAAIFLAGLARQEDTQRSEQRHATSNAMALATEGAL